MLGRVRDLKVQYANGTLSDDDKSAIVAEAKQLAAEIKDISSKTEFNGIKLLDGTGGSAGTITFQVGANGGETISVTTTDIAGASGVGSVDDVTDTGTWEGLAISDVDAAITNVSSLRSEFGAAQNRMEHRLNNLATYQENLVASESRIRDVDMAAEMVNFTKLSILQQAGTSMLAQANQAPQSVLSLLQG
jgi:flagellin